MNSLLKLPILVSLLTSLITLLVQNPAYAFIFTIGDGVEAEISEGQDPVIYRNFRNKTRITATDFHFEIRLDLNNDNIFETVSLLQDFKPILIPPGNVFAQQIAVPLPAPGQSQRIIAYWTVNDIRVRTPEPSSTLVFLALASLGAASTLKRKFKPFKSTAKELEKVS